MSSDKQQEKFEVVKDNFVDQWGSLASAWGVNRTMAQISALLMVSPDPLNTDDIMDKLQISRGNAHMNLKELVSWGMVRSTKVQGERKEFFVSEKDPWKMLCLLARERQRREIEPALSTLRDCLEQSEDIKSDEAVAFRTQLSELESFLDQASRVLEKLGKSEKSFVLKWLLKML